MLEALSKLDNISLEELDLMVDLIYFPIFLFVFYLGFNIKSQTDF
jgi:hypothetical protein